MLSLKKMLSVLQHAQPAHVTLPNCNTSSTKMQLQTSSAARAAHCTLPNTHNRYDVYVLVGCNLAPHRNPTTAKWRRLTQQHAPRLASKHLNCVYTEEVMQYRRYNSPAATVWSSAGNKRRNTAQQLFQCTLGQLGILHTRVVPSSHDASDRQTGCFRSCTTRTCTLAKCYKSRSR
jgi:hypothetical protein